MRKFLHHLFVPHKSNNHRARVLHPDIVIIAATLIFFSLSLMSAVHNRYPAVLGISYQITPGDLLNITNKIRVENKLSPLKLDPQLSQAAANKASDMLSKDYWAHVDPDGITPWVYIKNSGYDYLYAGENLARGYTGSDEVIKAWMASPTHRENMLSPNYQDVGFAIATGNLKGFDTVIVVEEFGSKYSPDGDNAGIKTSDDVIYSASGVAGESNKKVENLTTVASIQQKPLIDTNNLNQNIAIFSISFFIAVLLIDLIIIKRKKIIRAVSHNIDHIIYLLIILCTILIIGKGAVL